MNKLQALVSGIVLAVAAVYLLFFVEPSSIYIIVVFILTAAILAFIVSTQVVAKRYQYLITLFVLSFLTINYIAGFQIMNTILLISVIIGIGIFMQTDRR